MSVQFEEEQPFSQTGLPAQKPKGMIKFLMDEGVAWTPRAANIELIIIAIILVALSMGLIFYKDTLTRTTVQVKYDMTKDPMVNVTNYQPPQQ